MTCDALDRSAGGVSLDDKRGSIEKRRKRLSLCAAHDRSIRQSFIHKKRMPLCAAIHLKRHADQAGTAAPFFANRREFCSTTARGEYRQMIERAMKNW
jgi:hypothetical protein